MKGYIYIRTNEWCELKKLYKVGITKSIKDRNNSYITGEIIRGRFIPNGNIKNLHTIIDDERDIDVVLNRNLDGVLDEASKTIINDKKIRQEYTFKINTDCNDYTPLITTDKDNLFTHKENPDSRRFKAAVNMVIENMNMEKRLKIYTKDTIIIPEFTSEITTQGKLVKQKSQVRLVDNVRRVQVQESSLLCANACASLQ